ncbi:hypothetical protein M413DRAFT_22300 [Hebeloma cylindrosporum]|uniref:Glycosyltransferase family 23 protein n=1 Tax=Hebeloma cylindrosporum TaxID=76867 RepID=A0A0C2YD02_HEBCY|nr:hypothetical protein M413DRAFT_22300 [Hebeloma cylindrosporum h7]
MPRPRPLTNVATAVPDTSEQLTPRTPHNFNNGSRTSRAEQGFAKLQLSEDNDEEYDEQDTLQSAPLLASSSTARFSIRSSRRRQSPATKNAVQRNVMMLHPTQILSVAISRLPLAFGIFMGGVLLILIVLSFTRPDDLHRYIGAKAPSTSSTQSTTSPSPPESKSNLLSYENYTTFPLHTNEYLIECAKQHQGYMAPTEVTGISVQWVHWTLNMTPICQFVRAAALARERNRTFLVDDTYWNRGKWLDHFEDVRTRQPGPEPDCKPPPPDEMVACPRTSRHWIITSRTAKFHFGHAFANHYEDPYAHQLNRLKPIFASSARSLESTVRPNAQNMGLLRLTQAEFSSFLTEVNQGDKEYVGTHIRRGDRKSLSYSFLDRKIPTKEYLDAVEKTWARLHKGMPSQIHPVVYLATDSSNVHKEFSQVYEGRSFSLFDSSDPRLSSLASPAEYIQKEFNVLDLRERIAATRGMIVDLAMVGGLWTEEKDLKPEAVICGLSSSVCRLAAVGMGWEKAFGQVDDMGSIDPNGKGWIDVDQKGQIIPVWEAFELF